MILNTIKNGVVLDHIQAGGAMKIYKALNLDKLECQVAIIKNADSVKMGRKDILKICEPIDINLDVLGYLDPGVTVSIIKDGAVAERKHLTKKNKTTLKGFRKSNLFKVKTPSEKRAAKFKQPTAHIVYHHNGGK